MRMTRQLTRLADIAYRRRGRMVLAWIAAAIVIIGVGSSLAGEYNADYNTPGSESKAASDLTEERFAGYSGQEIYVVWKDEAGAQSSAAKQSVDAFLAEARKVDHVAPQTPIRVSEDGKIGATTLPLTIDGWDVPKEDGEKLIAAAERHSGDGLDINFGGLIMLLANVVDVPDWTTAVSGLIGIGVGIDYALLVLTRFRSAM